MTTAATPIHTPLAAQKASAPRQMKQLGTFTGDLTTTSIDKIMQAVGAKLPPLPYTLLASSTAVNGVQVLSVRVFDINGTEVAL